MNLGAGSMGAGPFTGDVMIYFIQDSETGHIKIGHAADPERRLKQLQTGCPGKLILLCTVSGSKDDEAKIHKKFAHHRLRGEWFRGSCKSDIHSVLQTHKPEMFSGSRKPITSPPVRTADLDPLDRELVRIALSAPQTLSQMAMSVTPGMLRNAPLKRILEACYACHAEGKEAAFGRISDLLDEADRSLAAGLLLPVDLGLLPQRIRAPAWEDQLAMLLDRFAERAWKDRMKAMRRAMEELDPQESPDEYEALRLEFFHLHRQGPEALRRSYRDVNCV